MMELESADIHCSYCGERIDVLVDCSVEFQEYVEDCSVCCRPIVIVASSFEGELVSLQARSENE
jgi:hypothetical protein